MATETDKLSITYSSGLIPPPEIMSTLAVFYDEVWLPNPYELGSDYSPLTWGDEPEHIDEGLAKARCLYTDSINQWKPLFNGDILRVLPHHEFAIKLPSIEAIKEKMLEFPFIKLEFNDRKIEVTISPENADIESGSHALAIHSVFVNKPHPELFISDPSDIRTSRLAGFLVQSLFHYQVPRLQMLNAEQILEVRDYLKDTKEGFTYYIHEMTDDLEQRLKGGNLSEMEAAQKIFERKILPQYEESRRQIAARKTGYWANVLSASADFLKVDATPWTPKFYGELLKWLGVALNLTAKDEEALLTNKNQAFQYLARLESKVSRTTV